MEAAAFAIMVNIGIGLFLFVGYGWLSVVLMKEALRPTDWLTKLRWRIFLVVFITVITLIPSLVYQILRLYGFDSPEIRNIVTITSKINALATFLLLIGIFFYKRKGDEE